MFGIVVVPGHAIEVEKREKPVAVLFEALFALYRRLALVLRRNHFFVEPLDRGQMLSQEMPLQAIAIYGLNNWPQQFRKACDDPLQLLVKRVVQHLVVQISHQVDQALLLRTRNPAVSESVTSKRVSNTLQRRGAG